MLAEEFAEANCRARLNCLKRLLNDVIFNWFHDNTRNPCR